MKFVVPMIWTEPKNYIDYCYFCVKENHISYLPPAKGRLLYSDDYESTSIKFVGHRDCGSFFWDEYDRGFKC